MYDNMILLIICSVYQLFSVITLANIKRDKITPLIVHKLVHFYSVPHKYWIFEQTEIFIPQFIPQLLVFIIHSHRQKVMELFSLVDCSVNNLWRTIVFPVFLA